MSEMSKWMVVAALTIVVAACSRQPVEVTEEEIAAVAPSLLQAPTRCPVVVLRPGTQQYRSFLPGRDLDPQALRYQATVTEGARECRVSPEAITVKLGVGGRVLFGPVGEQGTTVNLPLRMVVVQGNNQPVYSELRNVSVATDAGQPSSLWSHVEPLITIARTPGDKLGDYEIIVGFDEGRAAR